MAIISMLAALILGVAARAAENARRANTQHTVLRLHRLLMSHYDTYKTRRVAVRQAVIAGIENDGSLNGPEKGQARAAARLYALRELMILELPDRWNNVTLSNAATPQRLVPNFLDVSGSTSDRTDLSAIYLRRYQQIKPSVENESAECLYLIITLACGEGEARSQFGEGDIGDTDGDGAFEFLDGWGNPISFLRWAPGFDSQVQINANTLGNGPANNPVWQAAASGDHDPFDMYRVDTSSFRLVPLIYSAGGDESYGIQTADQYIPLIGLRFNRVDDEVSPSDWRVIQPCLKVNPSVGYLGTEIPDAGATDNIHNHLLGRR